MQVEDMYRLILGIEAHRRSVTERLDAKTSNVHVELEHEEGIRWKCPCCSQKLPVYDQVAERQWRHLDTCPYEAWRHGRFRASTAPSSG